MPPLGLYLHLPWCTRKCPYCDFNSHAAGDTPPYDDYLQALLRDLELELARADGRLIDTVFIGGGTPSLFPVAAIESVLTALLPRLQSGAEITMEANPGSAEAERFRGYREAGVNRLSLGVQSFDNALLQRLGRVHDRSQALDAVDAAREAGFSAINLDLMYGLPEQSLDQALADLDQALALGTDHLSHYQLTLEPNTVFFAKPPALPDPDTRAEMQLQCQRRLQAVGLAQYEISAYARPGRQCRHNLNYWRFGDYLAAGAGAHGKLTDSAGNIHRYRKVKVPALYMARMARGTADVEPRRLQTDDRILEFMMNALRLNAGFPVALFSQRTGLDFELVRPVLDRLLEDGLLQTDGARYRTTRLGRDHLDTILAEFLPDDGNAA
nr:radical SAM family heme chaperone HemW [Methylonatrum kenyense]